MRRTLALILLLLLTLPIGAWSEEIPSFFTEDESPKDLIESAMEIYSWFTICPLDVDPTQPNEDGTLARVADETLCNASIASRLLDFTFSPEIVQDLMTYETYTVIDGSLYGASNPGRMMDANITDVEYDQTLTTDTRIEYTVTVHYIGEGENDVEPETYLFVREKLNGQWLFTSFPFFW